MNEPAGRPKPRRFHKKSSYRLYLERCQSAGRTPLDFDDFLPIARRWHVEYEAASARGDVRLMRELEDLLCEPHRSPPPANSARRKNKRKGRRRAPA